MASKFTNIVVFTVLAFLILGSNTLVMAHGDAGAAATGGAAPAGAAGGAAPAGAATGGATGAPGAATFADQSGVMDAGTAELGAGAPVRKR